jgi:hypothetical protein
MIDDYMTLKNFHERYPDLHSSFSALKAEATKRKDNGLTTYKALVEKRVSEARPSLLISPTMYFRWLESMQDE